MIYTLPSFDVCVYVKVKAVRKNPIWQFPIVVNPFDKSLHTWIKIPWSFKFPSEEKNSLQKKFLKGFFLEDILSWRDFFQNGFFPEGILSWRDFILKGFYPERIFSWRDLFWRDFFPEGFFPEGIYFFKSLNLKGFLLKGYFLRAKSNPILTYHYFSENT